VQDGQASSDNWKTSYRGKPCALMLDYRQYLYESFNYRTSC